MACRGGAIDDDATGAACGTAGDLRSIELSIFSMRSISEKRKSTRRGPQRVAVNAAGAGGAMIGAGTDSGRILGNAEEDIIGSAVEDFDLGEQT